MESSVGVSTQDPTTRLAHECLMWFVALYPVSVPLRLTYKCVRMFIYDLVLQLEMLVWMLGATS